VKKNFRDIFNKLRNIVKRNQKVQKYKSYNRQTLRDSICNQ